LGFDPHALRRLRSLKAPVSYLAQSSAGRTRVALAIENSIRCIVSVVDADAHASRGRHFVQVVRKICVDLVVEGERDIATNTFHINPGGEAAIDANPAFELVCSNGTNFDFVAGALKSTDGFYRTICAA
jgi:hypothetical protein